MGREDGWRDGRFSGMLGTARAQYHLRQMFVFLNMFPLNQPEVMISYADDKFDNEGEYKRPENHSENPRITRDPHRMDEVATEGENVSGLDLPHPHGGG